jgi:hypothetical protein
MAGFRGRLVHRRIPYQGPASEEQPGSQRVDGDQPPHLPLPQNVRWATPPWRPILETTARLTEVTPGPCAFSINWMVEKSGLTVSRLISRSEVHDGASAEASRDTLARSERTAPSATGDRPAESKVSLGERSTRPEVAPDVPEGSTGLGGPRREARLAVATRAAPAYGPSECGAMPSGGWRRRRSSPPSSRGGSPTGPLRPRPVRGSTSSRLEGSTRVPAGRYGGERPVSRRPAPSPWSGGRPGAPARRRLRR